MIIQGKADGLLFGPRSLADLDVAFVAEDQRSSAVD
jgi:hypothetical protein